MVAALDAGAGPEIVTWPMLLAGLGIGALASQLGSVTVSSVPDKQSGEVGGVQNTLTNLGASIGTALAGVVLISALTALFLAGVQNNPDVPKDLAAKAQVELAGGIPFLSDADLKIQLDKAGVPAKTADAIVEENAKARIDGLRASLSVLAVIALIALFFSRRIPTKQPSPHLRASLKPDGGGLLGSAPVALRLPGGKVPRGHLEPPAAHRAALVSQQAALRRPGCLCTPFEQGTSRARAPCRGVLRSAVPRPGSRAGAARDPQPGPVPRRGPVPHAPLGRVPGLGGRARDRDDVGRRLPRAADLQPPGATGAGSARRGLRRGPR